MLRKFLRVLSCEKTKPPAGESTAPKRHGAGRLILLLTLAVLLASLGSYAAVAFLGIHDEPIREWTVDPEKKGKPVLMLGSSLAYFGITLSNMSSRIDRPVHCYWLPSASTSELEVLSRSAPEHDTTIVCVSLYDLNERISSDHRAAIVPFTSTVRDLWRTRSNWTFSKKLLSQYPLHYVRTVFPTAGRSLIIMIAAKAKLLRWRDAVQGRPQPNPPQRLEFDVEMNDTIAEWTPTRLLEQVTIVRGICQGVHEFAGPKHQAFVRLLSDAVTRGRLIVIVLPVSPQYQRELLNESSLQAFEKNLETARKAAPAATWLRVDQAPLLGDSTYFKDLAHINSKGKKIVTEIVSEAVAMELR